MTLSLLIEKGGLNRVMTATLATTATRHPDNAPSVAPVATVAVADRPEPSPTLSSDEEARVRTWLAHIDETDPAVVAEVLDQCRDDLDARYYFLDRSNELTEAR